MFEKWKNIAKKIEVETYTLYLVYRDPRVPRHVKILIALVIAYLLSPIDLIPDFIPVIGYLDDLLLITVGIPILYKMIPKEVVEENKEKAKKNLSEDMHKNWVVAIIIIAIWILALIIILNFVWKFF